jgi:putative transcriptional regulator
MATKTVSRKTAAAKRTARRTTVGARIIEGLEQAVAWTKGQTAGARVTVVQVPCADVREIRRGMGLSQSQFAAKFGFPLATLQNWEQGAPGRTRRRAYCSPSSRAIRKPSRTFSATQAERSLSAWIWLAGGALSGRSVHNPANQAPGMIE